MKTDLASNWQRAWFVDVVHRYAGHISGLRVGFIPESDGGWRCYAVNLPATVAHDLPRLFDQAKALFLEALSPSNSPILVGTTYTPVRSRTIEPSLEDPTVPLTPWPRSSPPCRVTDALRRFGEESALGELTEANHVDR
jgi:hypothetical protein